VCRIICTGTAENGDMAGEFPPLFSQKGGNGAEAPFHHRFRSRQIFGVAKDFCPNFPKLARKVLRNFCQKMFSHKNYEDFFWCDLQKTSSCVILQTLSAIF